MKFMWVRKQYSKMLKDYSKSSISQFANITDINGAHITLDI